MKYSIFHTKHKSKLFLIKFTFCNVILPQNILNEKMKIYVNLSTIFNF